MNKTTKIITVFHSREDLERFKRGIPPRKNPNHRHLKHIYKLASEELNLSRFLYFGLESYNYSTTDLKYFGVYIEEGTHYVILEVLEDKACISDYYNWSDLIFFKETKESEEIDLSLRLLKDKSKIDLYRKEKHFAIQVIYDRSCVVNVLECGIVNSEEEYMNKLGGLKNGMEHM